MIIATRRLGKAVGVVLLGLLLMVMRVAAAATDSAAAVNALADELLVHLRATSAYVRLQSGLPIIAFDPITLDRAQLESKFNTQMLARVDAVELAKLPHGEWLLAKLLRHTFASGVHAAENYWFDFAVTPYAGGSRINAVHTALAVQPLKTAADLDNYLHLLDSYALMLEQIAAKTRAQADRSIRVAKPAIPGVVGTFRGIRAAARETLTPDQWRLADVPAEQATAFKTAVRQRISARILPGYDAILSVFNETYTRSAPNAVGLSRYPGGKECYLRLIVDHTDLPLTPRQIHDLGETRTAELDARMAAIRDQLGFKGTREAFHDMLRKDPRLIAKSPVDVEQRYLGYIARLEPHIPAYFSTVPKAHYDVKRLPEAAEKGMTYGYFQEPTPLDPVGHYYYNGSDLNKRSLVTAAHLIYHELIPGHHFQLGLQFENSSVHPVHKFLDYGAFAEGWGEYAASLAEELGLYSDPYDLYGHLLLQSFLTSRLVVDTGMNYFGMSLADARAYMKAHTFESDVQLASETLRYSTDIYGQALSYRVGYEKFWELRHRAERALGPRFDIRDFHAAAIDEGAMPLDVLDEHINWFIAQRAH